MLPRDLKPARHRVLVEPMTGPAAAVADAPRILDGGEEISRLQRCDAELRVGVLPDSLHETRVWRGEWVEGDEDTAEDGDRDVLQCVHAVCEAWVFAGNSGMRARVCEVVAGGPGLLTFWHELYMGG